VIEKEKERERERERERQCYDIDKCTKSYK